VNQIEPNSLRSALQSAIDRHNQAHEYKVSQSDFGVVQNFSTINIEGVYTKEQAAQLLENWGQKVAMHYSERFVIRAKYLPNFHNLSKHVNGYATISK
jgi:hypothetical protein